ncbi:hypothetical protein [Streptomyces sp. S465]|uniref:hypothetical protein n=1 Tax=Streptomyces sp. S465 TaxID=2979468 RepID=UPI0022A865CA|nr:hypothetical protein [Streptomyces sp. S465]WAP53522.1 hypothetical protein N6H00_00310 [Streptomyces sp. S465]
MSKKTTALMTSPDSAPGIAARRPITARDLQRSISIFDKLVVADETGPVGWKTG